MISRIEFLHAEVEHQGGGHFWHVWMTHYMDDGSTFPHHLYFPTDTLEWRAAEYQINSDDRETLWDIVLAEFYMTPDDYIGEPCLYDHSDHSVVKQAHIARAARVKWRYRLLTRGSAAHSLHGMIRLESLMNPVAVAMKTEHVTKMRQHVLSQRSRLAAIPEPSEEERIRYLAAQLGGQNGDDDH